MKKRFTTLFLMMFLYLACTLQLVGISKADELKIPDRHPIQLNKKPICSECHTEDAYVNNKPINTFDHKDDWTQVHRFKAGSEDRLCLACHRVSFCTDCHAYKSELSPSVEHADEPDVNYPHRGDYLVQHRIDGQADPMKCFRCHGRENNRSCKQCHR